MSKQRIAVGLLTMSAAAFATWTASEGFTDHAVIPTKGDRPTIGHGSTHYEDGRAVQLGDRITRERAALLARNLHTIDEKRLAASLPGVKLHPQEFDEYVDFVGQYGIGTWRAGTPRERLLAADYAGACQALREYRFMTSGTAIKGWTAYKFDSSNGAPTRWRFDCSTPGNKVCAGVWTRQQARVKRCMEAQ